MLESNKLCRLFLFDIVPGGKEKNGGSVGESHDRIGLNRRRVLVNCGRDRSRGFRHTRLSRDSEGEEFPAVRKIKRQKKSRRESERQGRNYCSRITSSPRAYNMLIPLQIGFQNTRSKDFQAP